MTETLNTPLAGIRFAQRQEVMRSLSIGASVTAWREPDNPYDINAIRVDCRAGSIGYLPQELAEQLSPQMESAGVSDLEGRVIRLFADETQDGAFNAEVRFNLPAGVRISTKEAPPKTAVNTPVVQPTPPPSAAAPSTLEKEQARRKAAEISAITRQAAAQRQEQQNKEKRPGTIPPYWVVGLLVVAMLGIAGLLLKDIDRNPGRGASDSVNATKAANMPPVLPEAPFDTSDCVDISEIGYEDIGSNYCVKGELYETEYNAEFQLSAINFTGDHPTLSLMVPYADVTGIDMGCVMAKGEIMPFDDDSQFLYVPVNELYRCPEEKTIQHTITPAPKIEPDLPAAPYNSSACREGFTITTGDVGKVMCVRGNVGFTDYDDEYDTSLIYLSSQNLEFLFLKTGKIPEGLLGQCVTGAGTIEEFDGKYFIDLTYENLYTCD